MLAACPAAAKGNDWEVAGERLLERKIRTVAVRVGREVGQVRRVRIEAIAGPLVLRDIRITYSNSLTRDVLDERRRPMAPGETFDITFPRGTAFINRIAIDARALREAGDFARIRISTETTGNVRFGEGREIIETAEYGPGEDRVVFDVGAAEGLFEALSLRAPDRSVQVRGLRITYDDGSKQRIDLGQDILALQVTREVAIDATKPMRSVTALIRPRQRGYSERLQLVGKPVEAD
jgi:hypothetical protein